MSERAMCKVKLTKVENAECIEDDEAALEYARSIDFELLKTRFITALVEEEGLGWDAQKANEVELKYKNWLFLKRKYPDLELPPTDDVAKFWQAHISDSMSYFRDSGAIFGGYLHHTPYLTYLEKKSKLLNSTREKYKDLFGSDI